MKIVFSCAWSPLNGQHRLQGQEVATTRHKNCVWPCPGANSHAGNSAHVKCINNCWKSSCYQFSVQDCETWRSAPSVDLCWKCTNLLQQFLDVNFTDRFWQDVFIITGTLSLSIVCVSLFDLWKKISFVSWYGGTPFSETLYSATSWWLCWLETIKHRPAAFISS